MQSIVIDGEKCRKDGICIKECPFALFAEGEDGVPVTVEGAGEMCINCGHCLAICPGAAIAVNGITADDCEEMDNSLNVSQEQVVQLFRGRRSIRWYKEKPVAKEALEKLLDMSRWAPTARNGQPVHWIVLQDKQDVNRLSNMTIDWLKENNLLPGVVQAFEGGNDMIHRGAPCLMIAHAGKEGVKPVEDCSIALATVEAAAGAFGLGACWAGFFMNAAKAYQPVLEFLNLPEGHQVYGALMLGYPKVRYQRIPPREPARVEWR